MLAESAILSGLCANLPIHFVIAVSIVAMEGNGPPSNGTARPLGKIVLEDDRWPPTQLARTSWDFNPTEWFTFVRGRDSLATLLPRSHRPGWRNHQRSAQAFPCGTEASTPSCAVTRVTALILNLMWQLRWSAQPFQFSGKLFGDLCYT